jgi:hypothetical protein
MAVHPHWQRVELRDPQFNSLVHLNGSDRNDDTFEDPLPAELSKSAADR